MASKKELDEATVISREILGLAKKILPPKVVQEAKNVVTGLLCSGPSFEQAFDIIFDLMAPPPKRPIFYARQIFIERLYYLLESGEFHSFRSVIRYLGDYIDVLVKFWAEELTEESRCRQTSLGGNIRRIQKLKMDIPAELLEHLKLYDVHLYRPAKHEFEPPSGRKHRFSLTEAVFSAYITMFLVDPIIGLSPAAKERSLRGPKPQKKGHPLLISKIDALRDYQYTIMVNRDENEI